VQTGPSSYWCIAKLTASHRKPQQYNSGRSFALQQRQPAKQRRTCTSKFQLPLLGSSQTTSVVATSQQMVRLSLLQDSSRL
jgi:hypothetical protein